MNERTIKYYVGRINKDTGEQLLIAFQRHNGLPRTTSDMNPGDAFDDATKVNTLAARLNQLNDALEYPYFYFRVDNDSTIRKIIRDDAPAEVLKWFQDEPEEEEEEATEGE